MSRSSQTDPELDRLIAEITADCHDEDEALSAFENAFDEEVAFPIPATVVGEEIELLSVGTSNGRRELIAACQRADTVTRSPYSTSTSTQTNPPHPWSPPTAAGSAPDDTT